MSRNQRRKGNFAIGWSVSMDARCFPSFNAVCRNRNSDNKLMPTHHATCSCGQLRVTCEGEPVRVSICHCLACQRRTGSVFGAQARFPRTQVRIEGQSTAWSRPGDSGGAVTFHFCPVCGSTVYWQLQAVPDLVAVAIGAFADPGFGPPRHSVYERSRHGWVVVPGGPDIELLE
jgi:hypothetical protein